MGKNLVNSNCRSCHHYVFDKDTTLISFKEIISTRDKNLMERIRFPNSHKVIVDNFSNSEIDCMINYIRNIDTLRLYHTPRQP